MSTLPVVVCTPKRIVCPDESKWTGKMAPYPAKPPNSPQVFKHQHTSRYRIRIGMVKSVTNLLVYYVDRGTRTLIWLLKTISLPGVNAM